MSPGGLDIRAGGALHVPYVHEPEAGTRSAIDSVTPAPYFDLRVRP
ncbi:hypothetical protein ACIP2Y_07915 [Streptomyces sviceus]